MMFYPLPLCLLLLCWAAGCGHERMPAGADERAPNAGAPPVVDSLAGLAHRYAPFVYHATDPKGGRQDVPSNVDFDGDLVGANNWEHFERYRLRPTLYYTVVSTRTHHFLSYHVFHPRDWSRLPLWLNDTHENDGENLQVVVRRRDGRVVLLWTQAHFRSRVYAVPGGGFSNGATRLRAPPLLVDEAGRPDSLGRHAAVFVEAYGHGIYGAHDRPEDVRIGADGTAFFERGSGLVLRPAQEGEAVEEPTRFDRGAAPYVLESLPGKLWPLLQDGRLSGDGRLLDGAVPYHGPRGVVAVPRYYDADRFSGPLGNDRGISPFALDFGFRKGTLGALLFDPARRYPERLTVAGDWSRDYLHYPF